MTDAAIDDASDVQQAESARDNENLVERRKIDAIDYVLGDQRGRRYIHDLLVDCKVFGSCFSQGDAHSAFYKIGQQDIGHKLMSKITAHKGGESYLAMMNEAQAEREELSLTPDERRKDGSGN